MFEKVNPSHPDKLADRIAGAIVDVAYNIEDNPKIAVEVLIGHGKCHIIAETSVHIPIENVTEIVDRLIGAVEIDYKEYEQDTHLADNQSNEIRCGDNGIFKGTPVTDEQRMLADIAKRIYEVCPYDGKYIIDGDRLILCQSNIDTNILQEEYPNAVVIPLGNWIGGIDVDSGATNRKLGSDMGDSVTGGGLNGKDLSKADVSVNIYAWLKAQQEKQPVTFCCAIGDDTIDGKPYSEIVRIARAYITSIGGFERFAEWGLIQ